MVALGNKTGHHHSLETWRLVQDFMATYKIFKAGTGKIWKKLAVAWDSSGSNSFFGVAFLCMKPLLKLEEQLLLLSHPPLNQISTSWEDMNWSTFVEQPIRTHALWNYCDWLKRVHDTLHFLKPEYGAKERCRGLVFFQTTWIAICWKVFMEFCPMTSK